MLAYVTLPACLSMSFSSLWGAAGGRVCQGVRELLGGHSWLQAAAGEAGGTACCKSCNGAGGMWMAGVNRGCSVCVLFNACWLVGYVISQVMPCSRCGMQYDGMAGKLAESHQQCSVPGAVGCHSCLHPVRAVRHAGDGDAVAHAGLELAGLIAIVVAA